jgi:predicted carbohydrate-binding protein with CBM5 and CBM33 domain
MAVPYPSMSRRSWLVAALLAATVLLPAAPAQAHGALGNPVSRSMECGPEGGARARSAACQAARAVTGSLGDFDDLRLPGVDGQDQQRVPDGKLCSAGLPQYAGLDLARTDWPTTTLTAGARFTFQYRVTIPHDGGFRLYLTRAGYRPTQPLRWSDLETRPLLTVANPPVRGGSYTFTGTLPAGRTGRAVLYTIWQTTSTPDTYYSCSDVLLTAPAGTGRPGAPAPVPAHGPGAGQPAAQPPSTVASAAGTAAPGGSALPVAASHTSRLLPVAATGLLMVAFAGAALFFLTRRRPRRLRRHRSP